jgi:hypothetical protein
MASPEKKKSSPVQLVVDLAACALFLTFFYYVLQNHVPSEDPTMVRVWATAGAACMTGVFWLAMHMVRVVWRFQRDAGK